jgi:hypothetical protein
VTPSAGGAAPVPIKCDWGDRVVYGVMMMTVASESQSGPRFLIDELILVGGEGPWSFPFPCDGS